MTIKEIKDSLTGQVVVVQREDGEQHARVSFAGVQTNGNLGLLDTQCRIIISLSREQAQELALFGNIFINGRLVQVVKRNIDWEERHWEMYKTLISHLRISKGETFVPDPQLVYDTSKGMVDYYCVMMESRPKPRKTKPSFHREENQ